MAERNVDSMVKEKRIRQEMTLERKIEILDQLKQVTNVSEFARQNELTRRNLYKLKQQEEKLRAAITAEPLSKPMRKRLNPVTTTRETKRQKTKDSSDMPKADNRVATLKLQDGESGAQIEVKPKLTIGDSEDDVIGRLSELAHLEYSLLYS